MSEVYDQMGKNGFVWFHGVVEDVNDPLYIGRVRVRCIEFHSKNIQLLPTEHLPWASVLQPITSAAVSGVGRSPTGLLPGSWVVGFFRDGYNAQDPIIMGSLAGIPQPHPISKKWADSAEGFYDPSEMYPSAGYSGEADTNRLAVGLTSAYENTIVKIKKLNMRKGVPTANGGSWSEPPTPYAAEYPYNHVTESTSGHITEVDDTAGAERLHTYHRSGTFQEVHPTGSVVTKIVGENYTIIAGRNSVLIEGVVNVTINGAAKVYCKEKVDVQADKDIHVVTKGNFLHDVTGTYTVNSKGKVYINSSGSAKLIMDPGGRVDINP